jgi:hypothetical protein
VKFILYECTYCLDDSGNAILFAFRSGDNVQNGVATPLSCPLCGCTHGLAAIKEIEIDIN